MSLSTRSIPEPAVTPHFPLAEVLWPDRAEGVSGVLRSAVLIALGTALLTLSAKVNLPLPYVPMTLQTLVVLMLGAAYGGRLGAATVIVYLTEGAIGLPVFAGPVGGLAPFMGPTAGYLAGFVAAAIITGWLSERGWDRSVPLLFVAMGLGHICILGGGFGGDGAWAHRHSRVRICVARIWRQARRREGMAGRDRALRRRVGDKKRAWS